MGEAAVGEAEGYRMSRIGCPEELAVRWSRKRRRSLGPRLVRGRGWSAGAGGRAGADVEVTEAETLSLTTSIKAPGGW